MATSADLAPTVDGLGDGGANGTGKVRARNGGKNGDGSEPSITTVAVAATCDGGRVEVVDSKASPTWDEAASIHVRMIRAQAASKALEKTDPKKGKTDKKEAGGLPYDYVTHDDVTHEGKRVLVENGVLFVPLVDEFKQDGNRTFIKMTGRCFNVDDTTQFIDYPGYGYGVDGSDKGPGKAMSYAKKMCIQQALLLNTSEDVEADQATKYEATSRSDAEKSAAALTDVAIKSWADAYNRALTGCRTLKDLKQVRAENTPMMNNPGIPQVTKDFFLDKITALEGTLE